MPGVLRASVRLLRVFLYLVYGVWVTARCGSRHGGDEELHRRRRAWYRRALELCGVEVRTTGEVVDGHALIVANHVSWLDVPVLGTSSDVRFLSKSEVARWPLIGWLARRNGTLFIRRGAHQSEALIGDIAAALRHGDQVAIFPEATTSDGSDVRHFHARLFAAAIDTEAPVQPVAFDYGREPDGSPPLAAFTAGATLLPHAWRLLSRERTVVTLHILPPLAIESGITRRELASRSRAVIRAALPGPTQRDPTARARRGPGSPGP